MKLSNPPSFRARCVFNPADRYIIYQDSLFSIQDSSYIFGDNIHLIFNSYDLHGLGMLNTEVEVKEFEQESHPIPSSYRAESGCDVFRSGAIIGESVEHLEAIVSDASIANEFNSDQRTLGTPRDGRW